MNNELIRSILRMRMWVKRRLHREEGQGLVEYALLLALIAILVIVALKFLQPQVSNTLRESRIIKPPAV